MASAGKPRVLLMGARRAGKSSIQKVVFHKMSPHETLFLDSTNKLVKNDIANSAFVRFEVWDFPGHVDTASPAVKPEVTYGSGCGALVWVIDAQDDHAEALARLQATIVAAHRINPAIVFEVFVHKVDSFSDEQRIECQREIQNHLSEELASARLQHAKINFHLTSIYDHSVFEAFSKVVQQLIPQLPTLENLLDILVTSCRIEKAFLFDVVSKIYIATDSSPVDMQSYELCADMIDVVIDVSCIYGLKEGEEEGGQPPSATPATDSNCVITLNNGTALFLREVNRSLALVCILKDTVLQQQGLLEYNFGCFRDSLMQLFLLPGADDAPKAS
jgi:Ras-related GTP-binding protein C/D